MKRQLSSATISQPGKIAATARYLKEALTDCVQTVDNGAETVDWSYQDLTSIPKRIVLFRRARNLILSGNEIKEVLYTCRHAIIDSRYRGC